MIMTIPRSLVFALILGIGLMPQAARAQGDARRAGDSALTQTHASTGPAVRVRLIDGSVVQGYMLGRKQDSVFIMDLDSVRAGFAVGGIIAIEPIPVSPPGGLDQRETTASQGDSAHEDGYSRTRAFWTPTVHTLRVGEGYAYFGKHIRFADSYFDELSWISVAYGFTDRLMGSCDAVAQTAGRDRGLMPGIGLKYRLLQPEPWIAVSAGVELLPNKRAAVQPIWVYCLLGFGSSDLMFNLALLSMFGDARDDQENRAAGNVCIRLSRAFTFTIEVFTGSTDDDAPPVDLGVQFSSGAIFMQLGFQPGVYDAGALGGALMFNFGLRWR
jgi:hypothetical protein